MTDRELLEKALKMLGITKEQLISYKPPTSDRDHAEALANYVIKNYNRDMEDFVARVEQEDPAYYYTSYTDCKEDFATFEDFYRAFELARNYVGGWSNGDDDQEIFDIFRMCEHESFDPKS
jgi:hypothetical protein